MDILKKRLKNKKNPAGGKPLILDLNISNHKKQTEALLKNHSEISIIDSFDNQLEELFLAQNPSLLQNPVLAPIQTKKYILDLQKQKPLFQYGKWVYFPWLNSLNHLLSEKDFYLVRTSRNKYLISPEEQKKFYNAKVGIGGLSIGSSVAIALVLQGGAKNLRLADFDYLALSNTNRIRAGVQNLGLKKTAIIARQIYEINPYANLEIFNEGITKKNIARFMEGLNVAVDELDNLAVKLLLRQEAKKRHIPVIMGADNGDSAVVDIERYDKKQTLKFFHGRMGKVNYKQLSGLDKFGIGKKIAAHIGLENHTEQMLTSLFEMGKTIVSWPQLGGAALLNGSAVAYCVRKIVTGQPLEENRGIISLDAVLSPNYYSAPQKNNRKKVVKEFKKIFKL